MFRVSTWNGGKCSDQATSEWIVREMKDQLSFVMTFKCMFGSYLRVGGEMIG